MVSVIEGDALATLRTLPDQSARCCVTSPPYWGLRDYGVEGQIGMESHPDAYVSRIVDVFREVRRVLTDDGTLWLNLGDSYAAQRGGTGMPAETLAGGVGGKGDSDTMRGRRGVDTLGGRQDESSPDVRTYAVAHRNASAFGLKHKDLVGVPWRVAFALQADGWFLRSDIIWHKPNPMPESVTDRPTKSHEYVFLLSKAARYYYDAKAISEPATRGDAGSTFTEGKTAAHLQGRAQSAESSLKRSGNKQRTYGVNAASPHLGSGVLWEGDTRNARTVWSITTRPFKGAHFATMPPELARRCILAGSALGDTVLDPFGGAGTTGLVADRLGRDAVLCELNAEYAQMARARIRDDAPLFGDAA